MGDSAPPQHNMAWHEGLSHENGGENTLYIHPVSGNAMATALYARDNDLDVKIHFCDIMAGEQMVPWFLEMNPCHTIPTLAKKGGGSMWQTGAILRHFAKQVGYEFTDLDNQAMEWRQADMYKYAGAIYMPSLFGGEGDLEKAAAEWKEKAEPTFLFMLGDKKFIGGETPSPADYMFVPVFTMLQASPLAAIQDPKVTQYIEDFKAASKTWEETAAMQTFY